MPTLAWWNVCFFFIVLGLQSGVFAEDPTSAVRRGRWAVLCGVDNYIQAEKLSYCGADQLALRDRLVAAGFPIDQVILLHDKAENNKYLPFKVNIEKQLRLVLDSVDENDLVVVAFSGHGVHLDGKSYFCPTDAVLDKPDTLVSLDAVYKQFEKSTAALKLLLVDACRNDPRLPGQRSLSTMSPRDEAREFTKSLERLPRGAVLLNSCTAGEMSYEDKKLGHGVFMHYILEGLSGAADADRNGRISIEELSRYANQKTKTFVIHQFNENQRPFLKGDLTVDVLEFEIAAASSGQPAIPERVGTIMTNSIGMKLTYIPAGQFVMGSSATVRKKALAELAPYFDAATVDGFRRLIDAEPEHEVTISKPFYMSVYEVTQEQYEQVMGTNPSYCSAEGGGKFKVWRLDTKSFPVENVTYYDAVRFCTSLTARDDEKKAGRFYRLPTEAEWEYACRGGTATAFNCGDRISSDKANFDGRFPYGGAAVGKYLERSCKVGLYEANAFGLYDMHGNVAEYCADRYAEDYYTRGPGVDPRGPAVGTNRIVRGGAWSNMPHYGRAAYRIPCDPDAPSELHGIRVVCEARPASP